MTELKQKVWGLTIELDVLVTAIFIILKLFHIISWSWWWVFSPIWICVALTFAVYMITFSALAILSLIYEK